jgi:hypothetical protein
MGIPIYYLYLEFHKETIPVEGKNPPIVVLPLVTFLRNWYFFTMKPKNPPIAEILQPRVRTTISKELKTRNGITPPPLSPKNKDQRTGNKEDQREDRKFPVLFPHLSKIAVEPLVRFPRLREHRLFIKKGYRDQGPLIPKTGSFR